MYRTLYATDPYVKVSRQTLQSDWKPRSQHKNPGDSLTETVRGLDWGANVETEEAEVAEDV